MIREMKNSGIEWIGQIPADWKVEKNKHCFELTKNIVGEDFADYELLSLTKKGIVIKDANNSFGKVPESYETYQSVKQGQLVLCLFDLDCSAVFSGLSNYDGMISPAYKVYNCKECIDNKYAEYWFDYCFDGRKYMIYSKSLRYVVNTDDFGTIEIILPPLTEQKKIADFLGSKISEIDKVISETKLSIENYKEYKQSVITETVTKGLNKDVRMKDSGIEWIGQIPADWEVLKTSFLYRENVRSYEKGDVPLSLSQVDGLIATEDMKENSLKTSSYENWKKVCLDDLVLNRFKGHLGVLFNATISGMVSFHYGVYEPQRELVGKYYEYMFHSDCYRAILAGKSNGMTVGLQNLSNENFYSVKSLYPPVETQKKIVEFLDRKCKEIDNLISEKEALISNLEEYKKSLIYEYVTGKKEVSVAGKNENVVVVAPIYPAFYKTKKARFAQAVLMSKILDTSNNNKGRVKLEKTLYTIEHHIGFDFETEYTRDAAGPLDNSLYKCETIISSINKWFNISSSNYGVSYKPTKNVNKYKNYYNNYFADYNTEIERIIGIFDNFDTDQAEIIATLYGAWNDFVIDNKTYTDEDVVNEVLNNWHDSKKRFAKDVWLRAIDKMRTLDLVPKGYGKKTIYKEV